MVLPGSSSTREPKPGVGAWSRLGAGHGGGGATSVKQVLQGLQARGSTLALPHSRAGRSVAAPLFSVMCFWVLGMRPGGIWGALALALESGGSQVGLSGSGPGWGCGGAARAEGSIPCGVRASAGPSPCGLSPGTAQARPLTGFGRSWVMRWLHGVCLTSPYRE